MQKFIQTANHFGKSRTPFFFLIDFEQQKPLIVPLSGLAEQGVWLEMGQVKNTAQNNSAQQNLPAFELTTQAVSFSDYQAAFNLVQKEIQAGNSYLLNLTMPTEIQTNYSLDQIFLASQAKYKLRLKDQFVCFSPECFVRIENRKIYAYPMKGTINAEIPNAKEKLLQSEKEFTEHNTIVDLMRNDLALVAEKIEVSKYRYVEKIHTHRGAIYQTSSEICGELSENWQENIGEMLAKLLPAGSISGAPKIKTVDIIQQAEKQNRGYYTGVFGYFDGENLESAVAIRYIEQQAGKFIFRSGGGITALSELNEEYNEILEKVYVPISAI